MSKSSPTRIAKRMAKLAIRNNREKARRIGNCKVYDQYVLRCNKCEQEIYTLVLAEGLLPKQTNCFTLKCDGIMNLILLNKEVEVVPQLIWSAPEWTDYLHAAEGVQKFIKQGGLIVRKMPEIQKEII